MGNTTSWLAQSLCPEEQALWVAAKSGDVATLRNGLARLTPETRFYAEWRDPVYGYSPLANACSQGHLHCVQALLAYGVDCNARDSQGNTPLHIATACGKSEVVRLLLEAPAVDYFAKTNTKAQTALDIARQAYRTSEGRGLKYIQCVEHIEKKLCIYSGWLYERSDNFLSLASGISGLDSWKKRYAMVLRTAAREVVEIDLFPMKPGERRPPVPSSELLYRTSDGIQQSDDVTWLNRKEYRLSLKVSRKLGTSRASAVQSMDFAASNQGELVAWKSFLTSLRVNVQVNPITTAFGAQRSASPQPAQSAAVSAQSTSPTQAALLQEQRDLERALRLSLEESRRQPRTGSAPSAPPPSDTMLETLGYSETIVGPDGVEIVQLIRDDDSTASHGTASAPPSTSSPPAKSTPAQGSGAQSPDECVICFDGPQEAVCVPCGHNAVCMDCAQELLDTTRLCPVCRQQVREVIRLYRV
ncbi:Ankyrin repeat-containing protein [Phytophthora cinnamomi]|uniref:Ankyrin repeat-containing protein n=1 Tax=Phytophthora cinnamomi TaxID=4785 RepID=UPI0035597607|nr:Ankyrin repeat-containing protein [Phytophthora cinnamomi]